MGPVGPTRQKADSEMASPFLLLFPQLKRQDGMRDAWGARVPSSAGPAAYAFVGRTVLRVPR